MSLCAFSFTPRKCHDKKTSHIAGTRFCHTFTPPLRRYPPTPSNPRHQPPFYTCVSYGPDTTTLQIRHLSDTNRVFPATRVSNAPICVSTPTRPTFPPPSRRNPPIPLSPRNPLPCDSIVSYGPDTTMRLMRRLPDTKKIAPATNSVAYPIWGATLHDPHLGPIRYHWHYETRTIPSDYRHQLRSCISRTIRCWGPCPVL